MEKNDCDLLSSMIQQLENIAIEQKNHTVIYVAIGSAANMAKEDPITHKWSIEPKYEQQFPPFMQSLKAECLSSSVHIFLIDPMIENPPFIVCDSDKKIGEDWVETNMNNILCYVNEITNVCVYSIKCAVSYPCDSYQQQYIDITGCFEILNELAIINNWLVVVQDYCGKNVASLNNYFQKQITSHCDHIVYGIAGGLDEGCYIDITNPACDFVYIINEKYVRVINPIECANDPKKFSDRMKSVKNDKYREIMTCQLKVMISEKKNLIMNELFPVMRQLKMKKHEDFNGVYFSQISKKIEIKYSINIDRMIKDNQSDLLFDNLWSILHNELVSIGTHLYEESVESIVNDIMEQIHNQKDIYKWYDIVKNYISSLG